MAYRDYIRDYIDWREGFAFLLCFLTVFLPTFAYWHHPAIIGGHASEKLIAIGALGGAGSFALYVEREERLLALLPGFVGGICAVAVLLYGPSLFPAGWWWRERGSPLLAVFLGGALACLLMRVLRHLKRNHHK